MMAALSSLDAQTVDTVTAADPAEVPTLPEVTVASHFIGVPYSSSGVSTTILNPEKLEKQGVYTLSGGLARVPGVYILDGGSSYQRGSVGQIKIRGMNKSDYALAMIDGMRVSDANQYGDNMFGLIDMFSAGQIEVVKGSQGAVYGSGAVGGVVAINTPEGEGDPGVKIFSEAGSNGSFLGYITSSGVIRDKLSYFVGAGFETTQNDPEYVGANQFSNSSVKANDFHQYAEAMRLGYQVNDKVKLNMTYRRMDASLESPVFDPIVDYGYGPSGTGLIYVAKDKTRSNLVTGSVDAELSEIWTTSLMVGYYDLHYAQKQPSDYPFASDFHSDYSKVQTEWRNLLTWNKEFKTVLGMAWDRTVFHSSSPYIETDQLQNTYGFFGEQFWSPVESLDFSFAARLDHDTVWGNQFTWRYANSWKVTGKDSPTRLFGSIGTGFRAPTFFERYADYNGSFGRYVGNPDLTISRSLSGDIGIEQRICKSHYATVTGFWTRINNQIGSSTVYNDFGWADHYTYANYSHATAVGIETALRGDFGDAWNTGYTFAYTYTLPRNNEGHQLASTARHTFSADLHTSPVESVTTGIGVLAGLNRTNWGGGPDDMLDDFITLRWYARWQVNERLALHIRVENITDEKYMTQNDSYNGVQTLAWGAAVMGGLTLEF